ncbi:cytochrome c556 [Sulfitobacter undariae]|uniref:Cytochrome c556 n=1 Tax=Sulfitobacter undariae TaxID=1563671 RepID=A0A7W6H0E5_9RHOB|nr:cytochrome c [Sulfitobacter undariae]MBB3994520.1 cytochrome c556 [Sulfitobacter undariae]
MTLFTKTAITAVLSAGIIATAAFAESHSDKALEDAVKARHAQMQMISYHMGILGGIAKGETPYDSAMVDAAAQNMAALAGMAPASMWLEGSEQGFTEGSRAKTEIWSDAAGFEAQFEKLGAGALAMVGAADAAAVGAGMGAMGAACKACHEAYRGPKN